MKKIEAIIRPFKLDDIIEALNQIGVTAMTINEVKGFGRQRGHKQLYRGTENRIDFVPKIRIDLVVDSSLAAQVVDVISKAAYTGKIGDGKVFVMPVGEVVHIRTGESVKGAV